MYYYSMLTVDTGEYKDASLTQIGGKLPEFCEKFVFFWGWVVKMVIGGGVLIQNK